MSIVDKFCTKIGLTDPEDEQLAREEEALNKQLEEERARKQAEAEAKAKQQAQAQASNESHKVVDLHAVTAGENNATVTNYKMKVIVIEPKTFDDAQQVANNLREKKPVIINFEKTAGEDAKRIIDFISGTTYALNGEIKKVGHNVFLCAPSNVNVTYTEEERKVSNEMPWLKK